MVNRVLFNSGRPLKRAENIQAVYDAYDGEKSFKEGPEVSEAVLDKSDVVVTDEFPIYKARKSIMITHGIPLTKKYGLDQKHPWFEPACVDYVIAPSEYAVSIMARQAGVTKDKVLPLGMPRFDNYVGKKKGDGGTGLDYKRVYLYAPTFRNVKSGEGRIPVVDWDYIDSKLDDSEVFLVKMHMRTGTSGTKKSYKHIVEIANSDMSAPYLIDCDVLITDYSSILFDAHVLNKPVVLFEKDRERYLKERGLYLPYPHGYASRHCQTEQELVSMIRTATYRGREDEICKMLVGSCDGHSTERVINLIKSL